MSYVVVLRIDFSRGRVCSKFCGGACLACAGSCREVGVGEVYGVWGDCGARLGRFSFCWVGGYSEFLDFFLKIIGSY